MPQSVIISGASTGIGRAIALDLDARGFRVFAGVRREADAAVLEGEASERLTALMLDVTEPASIAEAADRVEASVGEDGLNGVVNNAGIGMGGIEEYIELDDIRRLFDVNVFGVLATTRAFLPLVRKACGRVVHIGSMGGFVTSPFLTPYSATKHAIEAFADGLRLELRPWGLHVALIQPGSIRTPIWEKGAGEAEAMHKRLPAEAKARYGAALDAYLRFAAANGKRGVPPQQVADAVHHALTAARPKTRYRVGPDAKLMWWIRKFLPDRAFDAMMLRRLGLPSGPPAAP